MLVHGNARHGARYPIKAVLSFKRADDSLNRIYSGLTLDLNIHGCCFLSAAPMQTNENVRLWLLHPNAKELTCLDAQVVWSSVDDLYGDSAYWVKAGVRFANLNDELRTAIDKLLPHAPLRLPHTKKFKHLMAILP